MEKMEDEDDEVRLLACLSLPSSRHGFRCRRRRRHRCRRNHRGRDEAERKRAV